MFQISLGEIETNSRRLQHVGALSAIRFSVGRLLRLSCVFFVLIHR